MKKRQLLNPHPTSHFCWYPHPHNPTCFFKGHQFKKRKKKQEMIQCPSSHSSSSIQHMNEDIFQDVGMETLPKTQQSKLAANNENDNDNSDGLCWYFQGGWWWWLQKYYNANTGTVCKIETREKIQIHTAIFLYMNVFTLQTNI